MVNYIVSGCKLGSRSLFTRTHCKTMSQPTAKRARIQYLSVEAVEPQPENVPGSRCGWVGIGRPHMEAYHDNEWGVPVHDDKVHFEFLILEGAQAGLSWDIILKKRYGYAAAFKNFDVVAVSRMTDNELEELRQNPNIIRNRLKIFATRTNAVAFIAIQQEFGSFDNYVWNFVNHKPIVNNWKTLGEIPTSTKESDALSKDLKSRGMKFVGTTIMYSYMQAVGLVNDHLVGCCKRTPPAL